MVRVSLRKKQYPEEIQIASIKKLLKNLSLTLQLDNKKFSKEMKLLTNHIR